MIEIEIPGHKTFLCEKFENLMDVLIREGFPVARACDKTGVCGKCGVHVIAGAKNLPPATSLEKQSLTKEGKSADTRLTCLVAVLGPLKIKADYW